MTMTLIDDDNEDDRPGDHEKNEHNSHPSLVAVMVPLASLILHTSSTWWTFLKDILFLTGHHNFQCQKESNLQPTLDLEIMISISFNTWCGTCWDYLNCHAILCIFLALPIFPPRFQCQLWFGSFTSPLRQCLSSRHWMQTPMFLHSLRW